MKLLQAVVRLCATGLRDAPGRSSRVPHDFHVTVPAPLARTADAAPLADVRALHPWMTSATSTLPTPPAQ